MKNITGVQKQQLQNKYQKYLDIVKKSTVNVLSLC